MTNKICIIDFFKIYLFFMKKSNFPETRVKNPEPNLNSPDWVIWAAWADRVTFEEIKKKNWKYRV